MSLIFAEHVHSQELYLVLEGKFKGTFDLFIINSQVIPIYVRWLENLNLLHWKTWKLILKKALRCTWRWLIFKHNMTLPKERSIVIGYELCHEHNCERVQCLHMQICFIFFISLLSVGEFFSKFQGCNSKPEI